MQEMLRDEGLSLGWGRSPGVGNGSLLQYSCLENSMDRGACCWGHKESDANRAYTATNAQCNFPIETSSPTANLGKYFHFKFYHLGFVTKSESVSCSVVSDSSETPRSVACHAPLSMEFSRQEYWSGMSFPFPGDLPDPGIKPGCPALQAGSLVWATFSL